MDRKKYEKIAKRLGSILRSEREAVDMTQQELASEADISLKFVSMMEGGDANPSILTFIKFCNATGSDPSNVLKAAQIGNGKKKTAVDEYVEATENPTMRKVLKLGVQMSDAQRRGLLNVARTIVGD